MFLCFRTPIVSGTGQHKWSIKQLVKKILLAFVCLRFEGFFVLFLCAFFSFIFQLWLHADHAHQNTHTHILIHKLPPAHTLAVRCIVANRLQMKIAICIAVDLVSDFVPNSAVLFFFLYPLPFIASLSSLVVGVIESHSNTPAYTPIKHTRQS